MRCLFYHFKIYFEFFYGWGSTASSLQSKYERGRGGEGGGVSSVYFRPFLLPDIGSKNSILN